MRGAEIIASRHLNAVDYYAPPTDRSIEKWASELHDAGVVVVQRYLFEGGKGITVSERRALHGKAISIDYGFESGSSNWRGGYRQGRIDGRRARNLAKHVGAPVGAPIYYAVDEDAAGLGMLQVSQSYLRGCNGGLFFRRGHYPARAYGGFDVIEAWKKPGFQTVAWSGGRVSRYTRLLQWGFNTTIAGHPVDKDSAADRDGSHLPSGKVGRE